MQMPNFVDLLARSHLAVGCHCQEAEAPVFLDEGASFSQRSRVISRQAACESQCLSVRLEFVRLDPRPKLVIDRGSETMAGDRRHHGAPY